MFTCGRLVDQATQENDLPAPGAVLAESVQLCRKDTTNITRIVSKAMDKLQKPSIQIRLKALRYLLHLAQNGPPAVSNELKLYSTQISQTMSWRGQPHPTRGWEPYQEMQDVAQSLIDLVFSAQTQAPSYSFQQAEMSKNTQSRSAGISYQESYGSTYTYNSNGSLEPRKLGGQKDVTEEVVDFFKKTFGFEKKQPQQSKYGTVTGGAMTGSYSCQQAAPAYQYQPQAQPPPQVQPAYTPPPPPQRGQFDHLQNNVSWADKKMDVPVAKPKETAQSPVTKLIKVTGNRAIPTNGEISAFKRAIQPEYVEELIEGLKSNDWKVKVRVIAGLDAAGETYGYGAVSCVKTDIEKLLNAPQASLKGSASKFYAKIKDVEYTGIPEAPSAFDFTSEEAPKETEAAISDEVINFGEEEPAAEKEEEKQEPEAEPEAAPQTEE